VGAGNIIAVDTFDQKLECSREFGATHVVNATREDPIARVQVTCGRGGRITRSRRWGAPGPSSRPSGRLNRDGTVVVIWISPAGTCALD